MANSRKKSVERAELEKLSGERQKVEEAKLERFLYLHEFEETNRRGSHRSYKNAEFNIFCQLVKVHGSNKAISTNEAIAEACMKVQDRWEEKALSVLKGAATEEKPSAETPLVKIQDILPEGFIASGLNGHDNGVILRCADMPCVGAIAPAIASKQELQFIFDELDANKKCFREDLNAAVELYESNFSFSDDGTLRVESPLYMMSESFRPYTPTNPNPRRKLESMVKTLDSIDKFILKFVTAFQSEATQVETLDSGFTVWKLDDNKHVLKFEPQTGAMTVSPMGRVSMLDLAAFLDEQFSFKFGMDGKTYSLNRLLPKHGGFEVKRGKGNDSDKLEITHPYYPEFSTTAPFFTGGISLRSVWRSAIGEVKDSNETSAQLAAFMDAIRDKTNLRGEVEIAANKAVHDASQFVETVIKPAAVKFSNIHVPALKRGFVVSATDRKLQAFGKQSRMEYRHSTTGKRVSIPAIHVEITGNHTYCIPPADLEQLEARLKEAEMPHSSL